MKQATVAQESGYTAVAFFVAPLVAALGMALWGFAQGDGFADSAVLVLGWTLIFYSYALVATLVIGFPCFLALRRFGLVQWWSSTVFGFLVGSLLLVAIDPGAARSRPSDFAIWGGIGGLSAFVFWRVRLLGQRRLVADAQHAARQT